jgi:pullulanase
VKPPLDAPEDIVLYELHIRDFSAGDQTVREPYRGTYMAFTEAESNGMKHLRRLSNAGLTHVHLLPAFDIASVDEDKSTWQPLSDITGKAPDSELQQAAVGAVKDRDPFNWGYDPFHYSTPEGSYSTDPNGTRRIFEFREMVKGIAGAGLRTVMDVVYNHTNASGQSEKSVLDKVVPGYYHRYNADGNIERSTCCENTATENAMMEKLMVDSVVMWAKYYKVDGFRFDIMGHHSKANMEKVRDALRALTMAADGVDGSKIYLYGEGWNFGEVQNDARFVQARQIKMAGTGIGTFNDRIRDAVRGGGPFSGLQEQGFATGLFVMPNGVSSGGTNAQKARLLLHEDQLRVSMAGNLKDYSFQSNRGTTIVGSQLDYGGQPSGYTADPSEIINYVSAHDNETVFDAIQMKAPGEADLQARVRMNNLALAVVALGQGIPFFHAGDEILRSKSLDRNSYNSGDWFNRLDWTYETDNWGVGLPPAQDNQANWSLMRPLLAKAALKPTKAEITFALDRFIEFIQIRKSSPLFRLRTAEEIQKRVKFYNTGVTQVPGLLVMALEDEPGAANHRIMAIFNATSEQKVWQSEAFIRASFTLHPVQQESSDPALKDAKFVPSTGGFAVPAWTAAVFLQTGEPTDGPHTESCGGCSVGPDAGLGALAVAGVLWLRRRRTRARA